MPAKKILISADGGLGDHITAEPAVRYLLKHLLKEHEVHIAAHWPRVFEHLGVPLHLHNFDRQGAEYKTIWTLNDQSTPLWSAVCFLLIHMVDYTTMQMMQRMLPLADRKIKLSVTKQDREHLNVLAAESNLKAVVAVHAGKSWRSKTFPHAWWQKTVDALAEAGYRVCLFGKSSSSLPGDTTGIVPVVCPPSGIDLRDKLDLGGLFALIEAAPVLLTNDSSPVQVAGAFDNWIVMPASIKHPDLVFPYRRGSPQYKTKAVYKKLMAEELFNKLNLDNINVDVEVSDWSLYLPEPKDIVHTIRAVYQRNKD